MPQVWILQLWLWTLSRFMPISLSAYTRMKRSAVIDVPFIQVIWSVIFNRFLFKSGLPSERFITWLLCLTHLFQVRWKYLIVRRHQQLDIKRDANGPLNKKVALLCCKVFPPGSTEIPAIACNAIFRQDDFPFVMQFAYMMPSLLHMLYLYIFQWNICHSSNVVLWEAFYLVYLIIFTFMMDHSDECHHHMKAAKWITWCTWMRIAV